MRNVPVGAGRRKNKHSIASISRDRSFGFLNENVNFIGNGLIPQGLSPQVRLFPEISCNSLTSGTPNSPSSRKHTRDATVLFFAPLGTDNVDVIDDNNVENTRVVIQKTSKVPYPIEASNSSIWNTLQIKSDHGVTTPIVKGGFFGGSQMFNSNGHYKETSSLSDQTSSTALQLNPAAFSRSLSFREFAR
ncbi:hypothetical protein KSS87_000851 [Heliosperma pusillum]|nr:hypothetical protein KSS87_000851 [Heliosperma pusillum]